MLKPLHPNDHEILRKIPPMTKLYVDIKESPRSIDEHRMFFGFIKFLFENQEFTSNKNLFLDAILINIGHTRTSFTKENGKYLEKVIPESLSFEKCTQKKFHKIVKKVEAFAFDTFQIKMNDWKKEYWKDDKSCANPDCHNPATDVHEIYPGSYRRQACIDRGWQVKICRKCHDLSHMKTESAKDFEINEVGYKMLKIWLELLGLDEIKSRQEIMGAEENINKEDIPWEI